MLITDFPELQTSRLSLSEIAPTDSAALFQILGNPDVMRLSGSDPLRDMDAARALIDSFSKWRHFADPGIRWGIRLKDEPLLIGTCGLFAWNRGWHKCMVGYELHPAWQRKGLMSEALRAVLTWAFYGMSLHRVEAQIHPDNEPSIKLMKSLGFVEEGRAREVAHWGGEVHDMLQFGLLWHELQPGSD